MAKEIKITVPDIGGATDVDVIDILVKPGMSVEHEQSLITLEGDKATMDIPSPYAGIVKELSVALGDKVAQGSPILIIDVSGTAGVEDDVNGLDGSDAGKVAIEASQQILDNNPEPKPDDLVAKKTQIDVVQSSESIGLDNLDRTPMAAKAQVFAAGPAVRRMARELGVDLSLVQGHGRKSRITADDIKAYVKDRLHASAHASQNAAPLAGFAMNPKNAAIDFSQFGDIEKKPLNKIKKLTGAHVHYAWVSIPHVTHFDEADITELEAFRQAELEQGKHLGYKLTILAFVCLVVSRALQVYPQFNASLDAPGEHLIYKKYCNIGIAVETPNGLVVPVIRDVPALGVGEIAGKMAQLSQKARQTGLAPADMAGGCFTISSLGGIGGVGFTPIVNSPEVAILGLSRAAYKPIFIEGVFKPRLILPLSLSYDHRVIDGAEAARFTHFIGESLNDIRRILL